MNPSTAMATVLVDELVQLGVRHAVLCPGSRSAPLAYALQQADRAGHLTLHVRVDERSAGFLALGLAKLTRVPAVVVTTSGTAVANLHPAVLEAHHAVVPLIVLSADRPVELRGTGANQTTTQPGMYAGAVRWSCDLAAPVREVGEVERWRAAARAAVHHALGTGPATEPGPVHLNVQLREPLVPTEGPDWPEELAGSGARAPVDGAVPDGDGAVPDGDGAVPDGDGAVPDGQEVGSVEAAVGRGRGAGAAGEIVGDPRTLVVVGDLPDPSQFGQVVRWARSHGWPVVAEPFGAHPREGVTARGPLLLAVPAWLDAHAPARVLTVGRVTLSRPVAALMRRPGVRLEAVRTHRWIESIPAVARVWDPDVITVLGDRGADPADPLSAFAADWVAAGMTVDAAVSGVAGMTVAAAVPGAVGRTDAAPPEPARGSSELRATDVAEALWREIPAGATLFVGSSNSVRDLDLTSGGRDLPLTVVANRGLAGIDGCVSTAVGIALAGEGPAYAWMGDLTFLHDANGLLLGPPEPRPDLTIVVTNDDGGGIFTLLEPGEPERAADFERVFGTPTGTDLEALCAAHGVAHERVATIDGLAAAVSQLPDGLRVVEVPVNRDGRDGHRSVHLELRQRAAAALR